MTLPCCLRMLPSPLAKQAIRAVWAAMLSPDTTVSWQVSKADVARSGDLAYVVGTYQITAKNPKGKSKEDTASWWRCGKSKRTANGKWSRTFLIPTCRRPRRKRSSQAPIIMDFDMLPQRDFWRFER